MPFPQVSHRCSAVDKFSSDKVARGIKIKWLQCINQTFTRQVSVMYMKSLWNGMMKLEVNQRTEDGKYCFRINNNSFSYLGTLFHSRHCVDMS